ncbi:MAG: ABC transporter permease [Chloroflexia bacterium]
MATNTTLQSDAAAAGRLALQPVREGSRLGGFSNMFNKELGDWFGTRRWLIQTIVWVGLINGFIAFVLWVVPLVDPAGDPSRQPGGPPAIAPTLMALTLFFSFVVQLGAIGAVVLSQDEIISEKQTGTAAWILSKPVSRASFLLSKLAANTIGALVFIVALPALVAYGEVSLANGALIDPLSIIVGLGPVVLTLLFYLTLVLMLGVLFDQRPPILGIAFALMFGGSLMLTFVPQIKYFLPVNMQSFALALSQGQALPDFAIIQMAVTAVACVIFTAVALWRFQGEEF